MKTLSKLAVSFALVGLTCTIPVLAAPAQENILLLAANEPASESKSGLNNTEDQGKGKLSKEWHNGQYWNGVQH